MTTTAVDDQFAPDEEAWGGEGLPPVGAVCEYTKRGSAEKKYFRGTVIAYDEGAPVLKMESGRYNRRHISGYIFRPIPTARERWVASACKSIEAGTEQYNVNIDCSVAMRMTVEAIYDALLNGTLDMPESD